MASSNSEFLNVSMVEPAPEYPACWLVYSTMFIQFFLLTKFVRSKINWVGPKQASVPSIHLLHSNRLELMPSGPKSNALGSKLVCQYTHT